MSSRMIVSAKTCEKYSVKKVPLAVLRISANSPGNKIHSLALETLNTQPITKVSETRKVLPANVFELHYYFNSLFSMWDHIGSISSKEMFWHCV